MDGRAVPSGHRDREYWHDPHEIEQGEDGKHHTQGQSDADGWQAPGLAALLFAAPHYILRYSKPQFPLRVCVSFLSPLGQEFRFEITTDPTSKLVLAQELVNLSTEAAARHAVL